jgi:hypothetical protein
MRVDATVVGIESTVVEFRGSHDCRTTASNLLCGTVDSEVEVGVKPAAGRNVSFVVVTCLEKETRRLRLERQRSRAILCFSAAASGTCCTRMIHHGFWASARGT